MAETSFTIGIIGGGPGGLLAAYRLQRLRVPARITLFEASDRVGGKIITRRFDKVAATYEAGAAELYDYSGIGHDPLRQLIDELDLPTCPIAGRAVYIDGRCLRSPADLSLFGESAVAEYEKFAAFARRHVSPADYYDADEVTLADDALARQSFDDLLSDIKDLRVRRYIEIAVHSDVATEPRHTSATYGLHNFLMNEPGYMNLYAVPGGLERLPKAIADRLSIDLRLNTPVRSVERRPSGQYLLKGRDWAESFDAVVVALPVYWIPAIDWINPDLAAAMQSHHTHYDHPAHYLRVTIAFRRPFWREVTSDSYFMLDAFGGCCVYDESCRQPDQCAGVLGWLIAGEAALTLSNLDDAELVRRVLDSLPKEFANHAELFVEGRVQRWVGAVNARPGGFPVKSYDDRHQPDPVNSPLLFTVGDYLFDSTINGVLDSADCVAEWLAEEIADEDVTADRSTLPQPAAL